MWELQGRVGSELSVCVTYIYLYIYIICMLQKQTKKRTPYHFKFNNAKKKIYGNVKLIVWLLGFFHIGLLFQLNILLLYTRAKDLQHLKCLVDLC